MKNNEKKCMIFLVIILGGLLIHELIKDVSTYGILLGIIVFIPTIIITIMAIEWYRILKKNKKEIHVYSEEEKCIRAYHQAGHAVIVTLLKSANKIKRLSIHPQDNNRSLSTMFEIEELSATTTDSEVEKMLLITLGGRAAEKVVVNNTFKTSNYDLEEVTNILNQKIKNVEETDFQEILEKLEDKAINILTENRNLLDTIAHELMEKGAIYGADIEYIMLENIIEKKGSL